ncbi:hypothetical protein Tco_1320727 [Tanacetum coccineum]
MNQTQGNSKEVGTPRYLSLVVPLRKVGDEAVHKELGDRMERAATTASSSEAEQDSGSGPRCQDTILGDVDAQTRFETTSEQSNDPPLSKVNTFGSGEDSMKILELMEIFKLAAVSLKLIPVIQLNAAKHNVSTAEKPAESDGFAKIIDFLKASSVKMVNGVRQLQALIDKKKVIITKASIRNDLYLDDAEGTDCLPNTTIFEELAKMGYEKPSQKLTFYKAFFSPQWKFMIHTITQSLSAKSTAWNEFSSTMASLIICLATNRKFNLSKYIFDAMLGDMSHHKNTFVNPFHTKKIFANMKREGKDFSGKVTPLFDSMLVQATKKKKQKSRRKQRKEAKTAHAETEEKEHFNTPSNDPLPSKKAKSDQAIEIASLKKRVDKLEKRRQLRTTWLTRFKKLGIARRVKSSNASLGAHEDASKQGRMLDDDEVFVDVASSEKNEQSTKLDDSTVGEPVTTASVEDSSAPTIQVSTADIVTFRI